MIPINLSSLIANATSPKYDPANPNGDRTTSYQLASGKFEASTRSLISIYPRPDNETSTLAYHRVGYTGMPYSVPVRCAFGAFPYSASIIAAPAGVTIGPWLTLNGNGDLIQDANYCNINWPNPVAGTHTFTIRVTDQEANFQILTWTVVVGTANHYFAAPTAMGLGNGSTPANAAAWSTVYGANATTVSAAKDRILVVRGGAYPSHDFGYIFDSTYKAVTIMAYPGETPVFDGAGGGNWQTRASDSAIVGLTLNNYKRITNTWYPIATYGLAHRQLVWRINFNGCAGGLPSANPADTGPNGGSHDNESLWFTDDLQSTTLRSNLVMSECVATNCYDMCAFDHYSTLNMLADRNVWTTDEISTDEPIWFPKVSCKEYCIRGNIYDNPNTANTGPVIQMHNGLNSGVVNPSGEACFNFIRAKAGSSSAGLAINVSSSSVSINNYIYRNTFIDCWIRSADWNNVGGGVGQSHVTEMSNIIQCNPQLVQDGVANSITSLRAECQANSGVVDSNGYPTGSYAQYLGTRGSPIRP